MNATSRGAGGNLKCAPCPQIGCTRLALGGPGSFFDDKACDSLRCTSCDFDVISFDGVAWDESGAEYMFFRNNYPSESKMQPLMVPTRGSRAYCCQCSWRSLSGGDREKVDAVAGKLRWVCGGHL